MSVLKPYRNNLFASRDSVEEALDYCSMIADACGNSGPSVITAIMVLINTVCKLEETSE